jgi:hypothetical protein
MNFECIVTQVHIPEFDVQGGLTANQKRRLVNFSIQHLREFNRNSYIILTGHGHQPDDEYRRLCDHVYWERECRALDANGYVQGMPAQFYFVSKGLQHALEKGFTRCAKTRGDCILGIPNIAKYCEDILVKEDRELLITQQTGICRLGDCFLYGDTALLNKFWHESNPVHNTDGLQNTAVNYAAAVGYTGPLDTDEWRQLLKQRCSFRDVDKLKFTCLRWNYFKLNELDQAIQNELLMPNHDFAQYHWGCTNGWHRFDSKGNMIVSAPYLWSSKDFYK